MKFRVELDFDYGEHTVTEEPDYDGPVTNINDGFDVYHVEASSIDEAIEIAETEAAIDDGF